MNAPSSISPYVAKASVVAGVHTRMLISAASDHLPALAAIWNRATPGLTVVVGNRTSTRSLAGTVMRRPAFEVFVVPPLGGRGRFATPLPPEGGTTNTAFDACATTSTCIGASV